jgi:hypothetical protein
MGVATPAAAVTASASGTIVADRLIADRLGHWRPKQIFRRCGKVAGTQARIFGRIFEEIDAAVGWRDHKFTSQHRADAKRQPY